MTADINTALTKSNLPFDALEKQADQVEVLEVVDPVNIGEGEYFVEKFRDNPTALANIEAEALRELAPMFENMDALTAYGNDALEEVAKSSRELRALSGDVELPEESDRAMRALSVELKKASKYDMQVAENYEKFRKLMKKAGSFLGKGKAKAYLDAFKADRATLEQLITQMSGDLKRRSMERGVAANAMAKHYKTNLDSLEAMKERAAVLQVIRRLAVEERAKFPESLPHDHPKAAMVRNLDMFIRMINLKIDAYGNRWYTGVALSPTFEAQWEQSVMMAFMLDVAATTGMEKVEAIISAYAFSMKLKEDSDQLQSLHDLDNQLTQELFRSTRQTTVAVAKQSVTSSMTQETITVVAQEVAGMLTDIQQTYQQAATNQQLKLDAMKNGIELMERAQSTGASPSDSAQARSVAQAGRKIRSIAAGN